MRGGLGGFAIDAVRLYKVRTAGMDDDITMTLKQKAEVEFAFTNATGSSLSAKSVLVVGAGQTKREVIALGLANEVTAIDLDVIPHGWRPGPYVKLCRENGPVRAAKTVGRKLLGIDRRFTKSLCASLHVPTPNPATYLQMDATQIAFPAASFDLVYSFSVFEHLPDPKAVLHEAMRVVKPGGVMYISLHLYSSEGGCHDLRIFSGQRESIPYWGQLRPSVKDTVIESCYMNEWRLDRWQELFRTECPGAILATDRHHEPYGSQLVQELKKLRASGELADHTDEELLSVNLVCTWRRPV